MRPLIYVASPSYSGSTLLTFLMNAHPALATIGELKWGVIDLETYQCSCGALLRACPFWRHVASAMAERGLPFDLQRPETTFRAPRAGLTDRALRARVRGAPFEVVRTVTLASLPKGRALFQRVAAVNRAMIEIITDLQRATHFVDSSKDPVRIKHLLDTGDYDVWVIQLVRDGRGVVNSAVKNQGQEPATATRDWRSTHREIERIRPRLATERFLRVRYEDLCGDVDATMECVFRFCGVEPVPVSTTFAHTEHHILGNRMRLAMRDEITHDEKWRTALSPDALRTFNDIAGDVNRAYGYE